MSLSFFFQGIILVVDNTFMSSYFQVSQSGDYKCTAYELVIIINILFIIIFIISTPCFDASVSEEFLLFI